MTRPEAMTILFGQEDLVIAEFPELKTLVINLRADPLPTKKEEREVVLQSELNKQSEAELKEDDDINFLEDHNMLMLRTYQEQRKEVYETLESHCYLKPFMRPYKVILIDYTFQSKETFNYLYNYMDKYFQKIQSILFRNIKTIRKESFNKLKQVMKKQEQLKELCFEYTFLSHFHIELIRDILGNKRDTIEKIQFIQCGLNEIDLHTLFFSTIYISDFPKLKELNLDLNPLLFKSELL